MNLILDDGEVVFDVQNLKRLNGDNTADGKVFLYGNEALKVVHSRFLYEKKAIYFRDNIKSEKFLKPIRLGYDESHKFKAYTALFKKDIKRDICEMPTNQFKREILDLEEAFDSLSDSKIIAMDSGFNNLILAEEDGNYHFYLCDLDRYIADIGKKRRVSSIYHLDNRIAWEYLSGSIIGYIATNFSTNASLEEIQLVYEYLNSFSKGRDGIIGMIDEMTKHQLVYDYAEDIKKKVLKK